MRSHGHETADVFRPLLRGVGARAKAGLEALVAESRARAGDPGLPADIRALKGQAAFSAQAGAFTEAVRSGHLDLAEALLPLATQSGYQAGVLAAALAAAGMPDRAEALVRRTRGEDRRNAWDAIYNAIARAGRFDEAEAFALAHPDTCAPDHLAWARASAGDPDPFPERLQPRGQDQEARMFEAAAQGAAGLDPNEPAAYP
jgi:hypothetical protein